MAATKTKGARNAKEPETPRMFKRTRWDQELEELDCEGVKFMFKDKTYIEVMPTPGGIEVRTLLTPMTIRPSVSNVVVILSPTD